MTKLENLFKILYLLQAGNIFTAKAMSENIGTSARNARAYVNTLINAHVPIYSVNGRRGGYYLDKNYFMKAPDLTEKEILALKILREMMNNNHSCQFTPDMMTALSKILLTGKKQACSKAEQKLKAPNASTQSMLSLFYVAIEEKRKIKIEYCGVKDHEAVTRIIRPYQIVFQEKAWYLYGYCEMRKDNRLFNLMRIQCADLLTSSFHINDDEAFIRDMGKSFGLFRGEKEYHVQIRFEYPASQWVKEHVWIENQQIEEAENKAIIYQCDVEGLDTIEGWVLRYGALAQVIEPEELRDRIKDTLKRIMAGY